MDSTGGTGGTSAGRAPETGSGAHLLLATPLTPEACCLLLAARCAAGWHVRYRVPPATARPVVGRVTPEGFLLRWRAGARRLAPAAAEGVFAPVIDRHGGPARMRVHVRWRPSRSASLGTAAGLLFLAAAPAGGPLAGAAPASGPWGLPAPALPLLPPDGLAAALALTGVWLVDAWSARRDRAALTHFLCRTLDGRADRPDAWGGRLQLPKENAG